MSTGRQRKGGEMRKLNGPSLKALRLALGIPAGQFAIDCDITPGYLSNIEAGRKQPTDAVISRFAKRLGETKDAITYPVEIAKAA
jgi:transcriptional regulator with XRE-family HTH domain